MDFNALDWASVLSSFGLYLAGLITGILTGKFNKK